ncbi:MAG TPA: ubiquinol-cytochrome c reductase iron-sulfur subunit [Candidatus Dormibacteraeota bacterium]|nr:ubiquinol-cytochrome c reductase iron-sulfur subunit [Candidatus Dormibacteraeota bacterium]
MSSTQNTTTDDLPIRRRVTRRNFIVWYLAGLLTALVVAIIAPILVYVYPPPSQTKRQGIKVQLPTPLDQIEPGTAVEFQSPPQTGFLMVDGGGDNYAGKIGFKGYVVNVGSELVVLSATCSHLGCQINPPSGGQKIFLCPCHGSEFDLRGKVVHGPAIAPLSHYAWHASGPGEITVLGVPLPGVG